MTLIKARTDWLTLASRGILFSLIWYVLTGGAIASWWIGVPAVLLAILSSTLLLPPASFIWHEFLRFLPFFLVRSLAGGADVAWRAFHPRMPIAPKLIEYPLQLPSGLPQVILVNTVNLLPGTLCAELGEQYMKVHVIDGQKDCLSELEALEQHVARIFGKSLNIIEGDQ